MDLVNSVPVQVEGSESLPALSARLKDRIGRRAYRNFIERGSAPGGELDDWLAAERELLIRPIPLLSREGEDVFVDLILPDLDLPNLKVHVLPWLVVISSDPGEDDLQLWQVIDLPVEVIPASVDAELFKDMLRVVAAVAVPAAQPA